MSVCPDETTVRRLRYQLEDGSYLGSCDWGYCDREQVGWAFSSSDASEEWVPICRLCASGYFPVENDEPYPVDGFVSFDALSEPSR